jgi:hypothetical protein
MEWRTNGHVGAVSGWEFMGRRKYLKWDGFDLVFLWLLALLDAVGVILAFGRESVS